MNLIFCFLWITCIRNDLCSIYDLSKDGRMEHGNKVRLRIGLSFASQDGCRDGQIMKLKEIYERLEFSTDKCEDAANVISDIVVKNS